MCFCSNKGYIFEKILYLSSNAITSQSGDALQGGIVKLIDQVFQFVPLAAILADKSDGPSLWLKVKRALAMFTFHGGFQPNLLPYAELFKNPIQDPVRGLCSNHFPETVEGLTKVDGHQFGGGVGRQGVP